MWKKRTLIAVSFSLLAVLPLAAGPPTNQGKGGGGDKTVPGGPGLIAFNDTGVIMVMNPDGTGLTQVAVTDTASNQFGIHNRKPAWSPMLFDGTVKLAFPIFDSAIMSRFLMVVDVLPGVGAPVPVVGLELPETADSGGLFQVDWSSAEALDAQTDNIQICFSTFETIGGEKRQVIQIVGLLYDHLTGTFVVDPAAAEVVVDAGLGASYWQGRFSPDGQWLALGRNDRLSDGNYHKSVWLASIDGAVQRPLIDEPGVLHWYPAWSPDGSQLAFISDRDGFQETYVATLDAAMSIVSIDPVTSSRKVVESWPTWSPDGLQIAYDSPGKGGNGLIGKVLPTGEQFKLADGQWPDWSPAIP